jgi:exonuclease SbcD
VRFLHTSDWHLGRGLHGAALHQAQEEVLQQIIGIAADAGVDAILIAGDVYDRAVPPLESVALLHRTLSRLTRIAPVILTPGNHDSATRLGFGADLYQDSLHVRWRMERVAEPVILRDTHGEVAIYPFPYLDPDDARFRLAADPDQPLDKSHESVMTRAMDLVREDLAGRGISRSVVVAHAFVVGSAGRVATEVSDSERDITVGTVDSVAAHVYAGANYVALGHLHGRQNPRPPEGGPVLHYSGSPLRYSFSEAGHTKSVTIVDLDGDGAVQLEHVDLRQPRGMARLAGTLAELLDAAEADPALQDEWVQVTVTDPSRPLEMVARLRRAYPHCLVIRHEPDGQPLAQARGGVNTAALSPREVLAEFIEQMGGVPVTVEEMAALEPVLAGVFGEGN